MKKKISLLGEGTTCPRCLGRKPRGKAGRGIAFSRRGVAYICAPCGTEESMLDTGILFLETHIAIREDRLAAEMARSQAPTFQKPQAIR